MLLAVCKRQNALSKLKVELDHRERSETGLRCRGASLEEIELIIVESSSVTEGGKDTRNAIRLFEYCSSGCDPSGSTYHITGAAKQQHIDSSVKKRKSTTTQKKRGSSKKVNDEEVEATTFFEAYALAKIHMHLVYSDSVTQQGEGSAFQKRMFSNLAQEYHEKCDMLFSKEGAMERMDAFLEWSLPYTGLTTMMLIALTLYRYRGLTYELSPMKKSSLEYYAIDRASPLVVVSELFVMWVK
ncbi:hypothetical protein IFM89_026742 [Coptis chinensis]|uniref:Uncharacterized protein n=1 Tax=Coptis chinensis TaxID=261450 RepID=A0A835IEV4_9MAGN|nr:hypothetical protein IFM89_026742 [Coptis chinensis]